MHVQSLVSVVKLATMLEAFTTEEQLSFVRLLWAESRDVKDIHKEMFALYGWNCLSLKAVHNWMANVSLMTKRLKRRCGIC
jgi:hypothetical protein